MTELTRAEVQWLYECIECPNDETANKAKQRLLDHDAAQRERLAAGA